MVSKIQQAGSLAGLKLPVNIRTLVIFSILVLLSIPSVVNFRTFNLFLAGTVVDFNLYQLAVIMLFIWVALRTKKIHTSFTVRSLFLIFCLIFLYNMILGLVPGPHFFSPLLRGIFNFSLNVIIAVLILYIIKNWVDLRSFALAVVLFGNVVALSALVEFFFLKNSWSMLQKWRNLIWGSTASPEMILTAGGVKLDPMGLSRVGGLIGAPENLGFVLAITLPFAFFLGLSLRRHIWIVGLYIVVAVVASSRTLGIALLIYTIFLFEYFRGYAAKFGVLGAWVIPLTTVFLIGINVESFTRFNREAFLFEWQWRTKLLSDLFEAVKNGDLWLTGLGFGGGISEQFGIRYLDQGIFGGDLALAYGLGGIVGLLVLFGLWKIIFKVKTKVRRVSPTVRLAMNMYMIYLALRSLLDPQLIRLVITSDIITVLTIAFLIIMESVSKRKPRSLSYELQGQQESGTYLFKNKKRLAALDLLKQKSERNEDSSSH